MTDVVQKPNPNSVYVTGLCASGADKMCKRVYMYRGRRIWCRCSCHAAAQRMYEELTDLAGTDKEPYHEIRDMVSAPLSTRPIALPPVDENGERVFAPTPTGRAARGQLEERVRSYLAVLIRNPVSEMMISKVGITPQTVAVSLDPDNPPSSGAVYAIFKRWSDAGYAELADKPFRLVSFTDKGKRELQFV